MTNTYRLILLEDDKSFSGSLCQALNKQSQYPKPVEIRTFSYLEYEQQFNELRNSTREIIVFGGRENLNFEPDTALVQLMATKQDRTHFFLLTPVLEGKRVLQLWNPSVSGVIERNDVAKAWLVLAIQRLQRRQQSRSSRSAPPVQKSPGFFKQMGAAVFSLFI